ELERADAREPRSGRGRWARAYAPRARDSPLGRRGSLERTARSDAVGNRADGEVTPVERLPDDRRREPHRGESLGAVERPHRADAVGPGGSGVGPSRKKGLTGRGGGFRESRPPGEQVLAGRATPTVHFPEDGNDGLRGRPRARAGPRNRRP